MLKETIYSSLFILASKRNRVRVGYEKDWLCARLALRAHSSILFTARLVEPKKTLLLPLKTMLMDSVFPAYSFQPSREIKCGWGMRKAGFVRDYYSEHQTALLRKSNLVAPTSSHFHQ